MISPESKFVGEALEQRDVRTVFVSAREDDKERENRVILLLGPSSAEKSELIDFLCNYFYGIDAVDQKRFHIANEKFNAQTPDRPVQCYIFNETVLQVRPVILDTISCGDSFNNIPVPALINKWLLDNWKMRLDVIAIVFSDLHRMSMHEEDELQQVLSDLPEHVHENIVVFVTASDGSRTFESTLRRFGLSHCPKYTINTSCIFQKQMEDRLNDEHRRRYWKMSVNQFNEFFKRTQETTPVTISGLPYIDDGLYGVQESAGGSSRSSVYSSSNRSTVIEVGQVAVAQAAAQPPPPSPPKRPTTSPPLPPPPPQIVPPIIKPTPPPPPPKPTYHHPSPPPIPASPPPSKPPAVEPVGIPLYSEKHRPVQQTVVVSPPRPPNFAPPVPPALITDTTDALTNAMFEQLKTTGVQYDYATYGSERAYPAQAYDVPPLTVEAGGLGPRRHSVPDDIRHYADETTPPPVPHDVVDRYSTVAYMNQRDEQYGRSSSRNYIGVGVRDAHRLSREDLRVVDANSSPADSQSEELRRMYSGRSGNSVKPTGDVTARYVYDTASRNYTSYGERQQPVRQSYISNTVTDRRRWSKSSEPRSETYINDPYYSGKDVVSGYGVIETRRSRTSLHSHGGSVPELIHSENKYDYQTLNDRQTRELQQRQSRQEADRRSRRQSEGNRPIYIERHISPERQKKDREYQTFINMQDNPQYNLPRRETPIQQPQVPNPIPPRPAPHVHRVNGGEVYEDERSMYEAYSQIHHQRPTQIGQGIQPNPQGPLPPYDQVPESHTNHYIIPKSMRGSGSPIQQQYDTYGDPIYVQRTLPLGLTEETTTTTTTTRKEEIERKRKKKEEEERRRRKKEEEDRKRNENVNANGNMNNGGGYDPYGTHNGGGSNVDYGKYDNHGIRDAEDGLMEEQYNTQHMKRTVEHPYRKNRDHGNGNGNGNGQVAPPSQHQIEDGHYSNGQRHQNGKQGGKQRKVIQTTNRRELGWRPSNYRNPRDCFLNLLCFIIAPLVIIAIIVVIIVFVIIQ